MYSNVSLWPPLRVVLSLLLHAPAVPLLAAPAVALVPRPVIRPLLRLAATVESKGAPFFSARSSQKCEGLFYAVVMCEGC